MMMTTMLDHNDPMFGSAVAPTPIMVTIAAHFDAHSTPMMVSIAVHFTTISPDTNAEFFSAGDGWGYECKACQSGKNISDLFHLSLLLNIVGGEPG